MLLRNLLFVAVYTFLVSYGLERPGWLGWLWIFWPTVVLAPIIFLLVRNRKPILDYVVYCAVGLLAAYIGFGLAQYQAVAPPYREFAVGSVLGVAAYGTTVLALVITAIFWITNGQSKPRAAPRRNEEFYFGAAWSSFVATILIGEGVLFGLGAKSCGALVWGLYTMMMLPLLVVWKPLFAIAPVVAFCAGSVLPRFVTINRRVAFASVTLSIIMGAVLGFALTPISNTPCSAL